MATMREAMDWIENHTLMNGVVLCPACWRVPTVFPRKKGDYMAACPDCGDRAVGKTIEEAVDNWNAGITPEYVKEQLEEMEDLILDSGSCGGITVCADAGVYRPGFDPEEDIE